MPTAYQIKDQPTPYYLTFHVVWCLGLFQKIRQGQQLQRITQQYAEGSTTTAKLWAGACEYITENGQQKTLTYLSGPEGVFALHVKNPNGSENIRYIHKDHLGSWHTITDENSNLLQELSFDAWGNRRNPATWRAFNGTPPTPLFDRGFTGHEHLYAFSLINMNGRIYDPGIGRFLSPDPVLQFPNFTQGLNPYAYALNNPLRFVDPDGYSLAGQIIATTLVIALSGGNPILGALIYSVVMTIDHAIEQGRNVNAGDLFGYFTKTFVMSAISMGATKSIGGYFDQFERTGLRELRRALAHGTFNGAMRFAQGGKFEHGFMSGFVSSLGGSFMQANSPNMSTGAQITMAAVIGGTAEKLGGGKFANGAVTGAYVMMFNHLSAQIEKEIDVNKFREKYFGHVEGLRNLYTDEIPDGYSLEGNVFINNRTRGGAGGVTVYVGDGMSDVYLSPYAMKDVFVLYEVLGHEMIHVAHRNHFGVSHNSSHSEFAAYTWSMAVRRRLYGIDQGYKDLQKRRSLLYKQNSAYNYDKFGFHSNIPRCLWDW